jgi:hypothetical protein
MSRKAVKFKKPKILLVDLPEGVTQRLQSLGLNVQAGTFGKAYNMPLDDTHRFHIICPNAYLPNINEQEIIVIDVSEPEPDPHASHLSDFTPPDFGFCVPARSRAINPRTFSMAASQNLVDRLLATAGIVIVFVRQRLDYTVYRYTRGPDAREFYTNQQFNLTTWGFSEYLDQQRIGIELDHGYEIQVCESHDDLSRILAKYIDAAEFDVTLHPFYYADSFDDKTDRPVFIPLLLNKYKATVGGAIMLREGKGLLLVLPQFADKAGLLHDLFRDFLPNYRSDLFPEHEGGRWVQRPEYEHPAVLSLQAKSEEVQAEADRQKAELEKEVESERSRLGFLHGILTKSGDALVADVVAALKYIKCTDVVNADEARGASAHKEEDIWVRDRSPVLLVEVKGLGSLPREADSHQVTKYLNRRKSEWKRTDMQGVFLVNHQLGVVPLERDNQNVFTQHQINDAASDHVALITTWDLFRLIRGMERWGWPPEVVQDVCYQSGRAGLLPSHWTPLGRVAHYFDKISVVSLELTGSEQLALGDTVGYCFLDGFDQEIIESLQVENAKVEVATPGQKAGYITRFPRSRLPDKTQIYMVKQNLTRS